MAVETYNINSFNELYNLREHILNKDGSTKIIKYEIKDPEYFIGYVGSGFPQKSTSVTGNSWFTIYAFLKQYNITFG